MKIVQCMGGWCGSRESCAHYHAPPLPGTRPAERLCERGQPEEPVRFNSPTERKDGAAVPA